MGVASSLTRLLPVPHYLNAPGAGIDISTGSVRAAMLEWHGASARVTTHERIEVPAGTIVDGDIEQPDALVEILRRMRLKQRIHHAYASLPEKKAYLYQTLVPAGETDIRSAVEFDLEAHVPIPPAEALFDFEAVRRTEAGTIVSVTAYAKRIVDEYREVFRRAGIMLNALEVESQGTARALITPTSAHEVIMVVDFGKHSTRIAVVDHGAVSFTATVDVGGDALTSAVKKHYKVEEAEAEVIKNEKGMLTGEENRQLLETLMTTVSVLKDEVAAHLAYWSTASADVPRIPVGRLILVGGNANLKGLPEYLARALGLPVTVGNVWSNAFSLDQYVPPLTFEESLEYAVAIGLALRAAPTRLW